MPECKTVEFLKSIFAANGDDALIAKSALGIVDTIRNSSEINPVAVSYLHELVECLYSESTHDMLDHLRDGADCGICAALLAMKGEAT